MLRRALRHLTDLLWLVIAVCGLLAITYPPFLQFLKAMWDLTLMYGLIVSQEIMTLWNQIRRDLQS